MPKYFNLPDSKLHKVKPSTAEVMPLDITVRVDVSPWADPSAFAIFASNQNTELDSSNFDDEEQPPRGGITGA